MIRSILIYLSRPGSQRHLAQRYHPDREGKGDADRFDQVVKAYGTLEEPKSRAKYDSRHQTNVDYQWSLVLVRSSWST